MAENKFYLSFGRHEKPDYEYGIEKEGMLRTWFLGRQLQKELPMCATVYCSPLPRAEKTAFFQALGLGCKNLAVNDNLHESTPKFNIERFVNQVISTAGDKSFYHHFVTHLPVIEKLGLPELGAGEICLLTAENKDEMLSENYTVKVITKQEPDFNWRKQRGLLPERLVLLSAEEIYQILQQSD
ncbi:MAG: hypothetical protein J6039_06215 [Alphaproteobacteria bacterium]|nr:hypothetical protein [Alphaproteobacteria bacterium]